MQEFLINQISGLNGLVNLSNFIFLVAFSVRDVLYLRLLSVVSYIIVTPYYFLQQETLWPPIIWGMAFMAINVVRIVIIFLERRPVVLTAEEETLYKLSFTSIDKRDFVKLLSLAEWADYQSGDVIIEKGQPATHVMIMISGQIEAIANHHMRYNFQPGELIGTSGVMAGLDSPIEAVVREQARVVKWNSENVQEFAARQPQLRADLHEIISADLAGKLRSLVDVLPRHTG